MPLARRQTGIMSARICLSVLIRHPLKAFSDAKGMKSEKIIPFKFQRLRVHLARKFTELYSEIYFAQWAYTFSLCSLMRSSDE